VLFLIEHPMSNNTFSASILINATNAVLYILLCEENSTVCNRTFADKTNIVYKHV
jgi:hypothetical protein